MSRQHETPSCIAAVSRKEHAPSSLPVVADEAIEDLGNDTWMARGYRVDAPNRIKAFPQLSQKMCEEAFARENIFALTQELKAKRARLGEANRTQTCGTV